MSASKTKSTGAGLLGNAFKSHFWDSRIKSANTTAKEMWLGYVIGPYGMLVGQSIVNSYFNQYLTDVIGLTVSRGAWIVTFMVLFPVLSKIVDAVTNLVMSRIIDSTVCRQGKVRPWLLISAPLVVISIILLFWMPFANVYLQAIWVVFSYNLYYSVTYTMWNTAKQLSAPLSTSNVNQRKNNAFAETITMNVGTGIVSVFFPTILSAVCAAVHGDNAQGYLITMSVVACVSLPLTAVQYFYTRERVTEERRFASAVQGENAGSAKAKTPVIKKEASFVTQMKACFSDKYWVMFTILVMFIYIIANMRNIALVYYSGWVIEGNAYGRYASIQAAFQMTAMGPMGPGIIILLLATKKWGRQTCSWIGGILCALGSIAAFFGAGSRSLIYGGSAVGAIGILFFNYTFLTFMGDIIDHIEWKTKTRCDGFVTGVTGAVMMISVGLAQGIFNLGLLIGGYEQPVQIGTSAAGVALFADQTAGATNWINIAYQGTYIILGIFVFIIFKFFFDIEKQLPQVSRELQERKIAEYAAQGLEYIPADELQRREIEKQEKIAEENRIKELKEYCEKRGLDFEAENKKVLDRRAEKRAKEEARRAARAAREEARKQRRSR